MVYDLGHRSGDIPGYVPLISADLPGRLPQNSKATKFSLVKAEKKRKELIPSPSSARITIDLTAEDEYASFPLTQLSERKPSTYELNEKESIVCEIYRFRVWAAPATPAKAPISHDLSAIPSPVAEAMFEEQPPKKVKKEVQVKKEMQYATVVISPSRRMHVVANSHVTFAMLCITCLVPSSGFLRSMVPRPANLVSPK